MASMDEPFLNEVDNQGRAGRWITAALHAVTADNVGKVVTALVAAMVLAANLFALNLILDKQSTSVCSMKALVGVQQIVVALPVCLLVPTVCSVFLPIVGQARWSTILPMQLSLVAVVGGWTAICGCNASPESAMSISGIVLGLLLIWMLWKVFRHAAAPPA